MSGPADQHESAGAELDGRQLAEWTVEAMHDPSLLESTDPAEPRPRRLVRDAVRALRRAELDLTEAQ